MSLSGYTNETQGYYSVIKNGVSSDTNLLKAVHPPIGSVIAWLKTFHQVTSGTADSTSTGKLINSSDTFATDGVDKWFVVLNTTDSTETWVTSVDSETQLSLNDDIFVSGENYEIYSTPALPDSWVECNGQTLSDSDSPFNGQTIPDLNGSSGNQRFLRGSTTSGSTGGEDTHTLTISEMPSHNHGTKYSGYGAGGSPTFSPSATSSKQYTDYTGGGAAHENRPPFYEVVWIMRVK